MFTNFNNNSIDKTIVLSILLGHLGEFALIVSTAFAFYKCIDILLVFSKTHFDILIISTCFLAFVIFMAAIRGIGDVICIITENKNELILQQKNTIDQLNDKITKQHEEITALKNEVYNVSRDLLDSKINKK